jgi:hypothetical protein
MSVVTHQFSQQQGILAVAAGGVDNLIATTDELAHEQVHQGDRSAQERYVDSGLWHRWSG